LGLPLLAMSLNHLVGEVAGCRVDRPVSSPVFFCCNSSTIENGYHITMCSYLLSVAYRKPKLAIHLPVVPMPRICGAFIFMPLNGV